MIGGWQQELSRPLRLKDGRELVTLSDAANFLLDHFVGRKHAPLEYAIELLQMAERTGMREDIEAATDQLERLVVRENLI